MKKELATMTEAPNHKAEIYYYDIGDYLSREQKLDIITNFKSMENLPFTRLKPNEHGDWISKRNDKFGTWIPIEADKKFDSSSKSFFTVNSRGYETARDYWAYNSSTKELNNNINGLIEEYYNNLGKQNQSELNLDETKISWSSNLISKVLRQKEIEKDYKNIIGMYRPYFKQNSIQHDDLINRVGQFKEFFPSTKNNLLISINGVGGTKDFTCLITSFMPDLGMLSATQCFPLYWYETIEPEQNSLFGDDCAQIVRHEAISDFILERAQGK